MVKNDQNKFISKDLIIKTYLLWIQLLVATNLKERYMNLEIKIDLQWKKSFNHYS